MYSFLLAIHSMVRWLLLCGLLTSVLRGYRGWIGNKTYTNFDDRLRHVTATFAHLQLIVGLWLYFISPIIDYFLKNFRDAVHQRDVRFFGMEHSLMMLIAVVLITIGSMKAKRKEDSHEKFKMMAIWYSIALLIIISSVPWPFSPLTSRPWIRTF